MPESTTNQTPPTTPSRDGIAPGSACSVPTGPIAGDMGRNALANGLVPRIVAQRFTPRRAAVVLACGALMTLLLIPVDGPIARGAMHLQDGGKFALGGDLRRTLLFLQQFGDLASSILIGIAALLLDPRVRARIIDWIVAGAATSAAVWILKVAIGRPRPRAVFNPDALEGYGVPTWFGAAFRSYPLVRDGEASVPGLQVSHVWAHSWDLFAGISSDLWSLPSSHSSAAAALTAVLIRLYPRLWPLACGLLLIVMVSRVIFGAHFPSDVFAGATVGLCVGFLAMDERWGTRLFRRPVA